MRKLVSIVLVGLLAVMGLNAAPAFAEDAGDQQDVVTVGTVAEDPAPDKAEEPAPEPEPAVAEEPAAAPEPDPAPEPVPAPEPEPAVVEEPEVEKPAARAPAPQVEDQTDEKKVFVCKYVGTPGVDERLQTGDNPISVSVNAVKGWDGETIPSPKFADKHGRSAVIAWDTGQPEPSVAECPPGDAPAKYLATWHESGCSVDGGAYIKVYLRNVSPWIYPVSYRLDTDAAIGSPDLTGPYGPVVDNRGANPDDQTGSKLFTFAEDSGTHTLRYAVRAGTESNLWNGLPVGEITTVEVDSDCLPNVIEVTPPTPEWVDVCGPDNNGYWSYEDTDAYFYTVTDHSELNGKVAIRVEPREGYMFPEGFKGKWYEKQDNSRCPVTALFDVAPEPPGCAVPGAFDTSVFPIIRAGYTLTVDRPFDGPGEYTITAIAHEGFVIEGEASATITVLGPIPYQSENPQEPCYQPIVVTLDTPTSTDVCGIDNDEAFLPGDKEGVTYGWVDEEDPSNFDVVATIADGYVVEGDADGWVKQEDGTYVYAFDPEFTDTPCPTPDEPDEPEAEALALTGLDSEGLLGLALLSGLLGTAAVRAARKRW